MKLVDDLRSLWALPRFRLLLGVRLFSQCADGMFQAGLASLFFFRPETMTSVPAVAAAFLVLLLPYTLIGPFTAPLLDRWNRRMILLWSLAARGVIALAIVGIMLGWGITPVVYVLALVSLGISRFMLAGLSACLPLLIDSPTRLFTANSLVPTLGGVATAIGAVIGFFLRLLLPPGVAQDSTSLVISTLLCACAGLLGMRFTLHELGPSKSELAENHKRHLFTLLADSARAMGSAISYLIARRTPGMALGIMAVHRFVYQMYVISAVLVGRNLFVSSQDADAGLTAFGALYAAMLIGHFVSVVITPLAQERVVPSTWIVLCLLFGTSGQIIIATGPHFATHVVGMFIFGIGVQGAKIAVDTIVQRDTADQYRGRAFSLYDVLFNLAECIACLVALAVLPSNGWSEPLNLFLIAWVWVWALLYAVYTKKIGDSPRKVVAD